MSEPNRAREGVRTIFVIEDEEILRTLAIYILQAEGYTVSSAANSHEALEIWSRDSEKIDLLMTDIMIPGKNGVELARIFRQSRPDLTILFVSGSDTEVSAEIGALGGMTESLSKPYSPKRLIEVVRKLLSPDQAET